MLNTRASTVLMIDDNADEIFLTRRQMRKEGIINHFLSEKNPELVMDRLKELRDMGQSIVILLDISMPRVNGMNVLQDIRASSEFYNVPVLIFSASNDEADIFDAIEKGADGYIVKPFRSDEFFAAIDNIPLIKKCIVQ